MISCFHICVTDWFSLNKLQLVQNTTVCMLSLCVKPVLFSLHCILNKFHAEFKDLLMTFKVVTQILSSSGSALWFWFLSTSKTAYNECMKIKTGRRGYRSRRPALKNHTFFFFLHHLNVHVCKGHLAGAETSSGCIMGRIQAGRGSVKLWAMISWESLGLAICVDVALTCTTHVNIAADQVYGSGIT